MPDLVVIGAGHNGLAAAIVAARAGWEVTVVEANDTPGGAVRTAEVTLPGFRHDLFATNLNLFAGSAFYAAFADDLARHGFAFAPSSRPFSSLFPDGRFVGVSTDVDETTEMIEAVSAADAAAWRELFAYFNRVAPHLFPLLGTSLPSAAAAKALWSGVRALGRQWPYELARLVLSSPREFVEEHFESPEVQALVASWGMHLDFAPDVTGGALFPFLESMASHANGMVLGAGGAQVMIDAMVSLLEEWGGELVLGQRVRQVGIEDGRARTVVLDDGTGIVARRAVVANLTPTGIARLVDDARLQESARRYRYGPGTMMIHAALDELPPWLDERARGFAYVHVGPYLEDMSRTYVQAASGYLPDSPTLVVGQPTTVDPSRAPDGRHVLWVQVRALPARVRGDAAGTLSPAAGDWTPDLAEAYADRVFAKLETYAPGLGDHVLARRVLSPADLEAADANLVGGDSLAGSHHPFQYLFLRPLPGWTRYRTPVPGLYMCGAATWPGAGVGAGSGWLVGRMLTERAGGLRRRLATRRT